MKDKLINKKNRFKNTLYIILLLMGLLSLFICLFLTNDYYINIIFLPITFILCFLFNPVNKKYLMNISLLIINIISLIRYVIYPIIFLLNHASLNIIYSPIAPILIAYELIVVHIIIAIFGHNLDKEKTLPNNKVNYIKESRVGFPILIMIGLMLLSIVIYPELFNKLSISSLTSKSINDTVPGIASIFFSMGTWAIIVWVLRELGIFENHTKKKKFFNIFLAIIVSCLYILTNIISSSNVRRIQILVCGLSILAVLYLIFPKHRKTLIIIGIIGISLSIFFGTFIKFGNENAISLTAFFSYLSLTSIDSYFAGVINVSKGINMVQVFQSQISLTTLMTDLFSSVPLISHFFDANTNSTILYFHLYTCRTDNIVPLLVQSYAYFGILGAPILSALMTWLAIYFNKIMNETKNLFVTFICVQIIVYFSFFMGLNTMIILTPLWSRLLFLLLIWINQRMLIKSQDIQMIKG